MNFQPLLPLGGLPGWVLLNNTLDRQTEVFNNSPQLVRDTAYFEENIGNVQTAEQLVSDRRLLRVALGAFGLQDDLNNRALVQRILEEGTSEPGALANRLADDRYTRLADAFGFGEPGLPNTQTTGFGADVVSQFRRIEFEVAVGEQDDGLRLALNAQRELTDILGSDDPEDTKWFQIMGNPPLRKVFEVALGLPESFGQLNIDRQLEVFKSLSSRQLNIEDISDLSGEQAQDDFIRRYLVRDQISSFQGQSSGSIALTLLQSAPRLF